MRELLSNEMDLVAGGDDFDGNALGCNTAVGAGVVIAGTAGNATIGTTAGVLSYTANELCQVTTTYIGESIGGWIGDATNAAGDAMDDLEYAAESLYMTMKWMTLGI